VFVSRSEIEGVNLRRKRSEIDLFGLRER